MIGVCIQAGGRGTRLASVLQGRPKALAPFAGATLVDHLLQRASGLGPAWVLAHHGAEALARHVAGRAEVLVEPRPLDTAGGLRALPDEPDTWLVLNVDHVSDLDLRGLVAQHRDSADHCTSAVLAIEHRIDEGVARLRGRRLLAWEERPVLPLHVTIGAHVLGPGALSRLDGQPWSMPQLVRACAAEGRAGAYEHAGTWFDAGTPERLAEAEAWWVASRRSR